MVAPFSRPLYQHSLTTPIFSSAPSRPPFCFLHRWFPCLVCLCAFRILLLHGVFPTTGLSVALGRPFGALPRISSIQISLYHLLSFNVRYDMFYSQTHAIQLRTHFNTSQLPSGIWLSHFFLVPCPSTLHNALAGIHPCAAPFQYDPLTSRLGFTLDSLSGTSQRMFDVRPCPPLNRFDFAPTIFFLPTVYCEAPRAGPSAHCYTYPPFIFQTTIDAASRTRSSPSKIVLLFRAPCVNPIPRSGGGPLPRPPLLLAHRLAPSVPLVTLRSSFPQSLAPLLPKWPRSFFRPAARHEVLAQLFFHPLRTISYLPFLGPLARRAMRVSVFLFFYPRYPSSCPWPVFFCISLRCSAPGSSARVYSPLFSPVVRLRNITSPSRPFSSSCHTLPQLLTLVEVAASCMPWPLLFPFYLLRFWPYPRSARLIALTRPCIIYTTTITLFSFPPSP